MRLYSKGLLCAIQERWRFYCKSERPVLFDSWSTVFLPVSCFPKVRQLLICSVGFFVVVSWLEQTYMLALSITNHRSTYSVLYST